MNNSVDRDAAVTNSRHGGRWCRALIGLSLLVFPAGCSKKTPAAATEVVRPVQTRLVSAGGDTHTRTFPGKVEASQQVELAFQVPGLLASLPVREGQKIVKNEVIAQLRQNEFQARLDALKGQLERARADLRALRAGVRPEEKLRLEAEVRSADAQLVHARAEFGRSRQLLRSRTISPAEHDTAQTAYRVAQENHKAALQMLEQGTMAREEDIQSKAAEVRSLEGSVVEVPGFHLESALRWRDRPTIRGAGAEHQGERARG
jgi:multidrug efflux system membrane fusion protein